MHEQEIEIKILDNWPRKVMATIVGALAVHPKLDGADGFMVTHLPTSANLKKCFHGNSVFTKDRLAIWAEEVQSNLKDDWAILNMLTPDNYNEATPELLEVKSRVLDWCRSIKP